MRPEPVASWMALAFGIALVLAISIIGLEGANTHGINTALEITGRFSFLLFWPAYAGGALAALFGPVFLPLKRRTRVFGLSFAAAHIVHLSLVGMLCLIGAAPAFSTFVFFGVAAIWLYLIAFFSIGKWQNALNPGFRKLLFTIGLNYIAYAFAEDFLKSPFTGSIGHVVAYLPFAALAVAGPVLRLAAFCRKFIPEKETAFL